MFKCFPLLVIIKNCLQETFFIHQNTFPKLVLLAKGAYLYLITIYLWNLNLIFSYLNII